MLFGREVVKGQTGVPLGKSYPQYTLKPGDRKPFWDVEENVGFTNIVAWDGNYYKVWNTGNQESDKIVANILANVRKDINKLLIFLIKNEQLWINTQMKDPIIHTFDIHIPGWTHNYHFIQSMNDITRINNVLNQSNLFTYMEMTPNNDGILGLNKPKLIKAIPVTLPNGKTINYELGDKRSIHLTLRNMKNGKIMDYSKIMDLAIHELTHTTCNDLYWVSELKGGNHRHPFPVYHKFMRKCSRECKIPLTETK